MSLSDIIKEALDLKPQDRYIVIENLIQSLNQPNNEIDQAWIKESLNRLSAYKKGEAKTLSFEEVFAK